MKEASGEFSMTLVVIVGAIAIIGILSALKGPMQNWIEKQWQGISCEGGVYDADGKCVK